MISRNRRLWLGLVALCLLCSLPSSSARAGIFDSIKGFFGKASDTVKGWFSGGGTKEFEEMLQKVIASQEVLAEKQSDVYDYIGHVLPRPSDPKYQAKMNAFAEASRNNEKLYLKLLEVRQELVDKKRDLSKYKDTLDRIQRTQRSLEESSQAIHRKSRELGAYKPPAQVAGASGASLGDQPWLDPRVQGFIDEWLAANGLNQFGVLLGGVVVSSTDPDFDGPRHQWVWEQLANKRGRLNGVTLAEYVRRRLDGEAASPPAGHIETASAAGQVSHGGSQMERGSSTAAVSSAVLDDASSSGGSASLEGTEQQLRTAVASYEELAKRGKGGSDEAKKLLETIKGLKAKRDRMIREKSAAASGH